MDWGIYLSYLERMSSQYFILAGFAFFTLYIFRRRNFIRKKIQKRFPKKTQYFREIAYSIGTMLIYAGVMLFLIDGSFVRPHVRYYTDIHEYGLLYFSLAFPLMFLIQETYFYWTHRLLHTKKLFESIHYVHHQSTNPSPWTSYSFHPLEALISSGTPVIFLLFLPMHPLHLSFFFFFTVAYNVLGHCGFELYPRWFSRTWLGRWNNTSTHHNYHHSHERGNYSLYFLFWDRLMGTLRKA